MLTDDQRYDGADRYGNNSHSLNLCTVKLRSEGRLHIPTGGSGSPLSILKQVENRDPYL